MTTLATRFTELCAKMSVEVSAQSLWWNKIQTRYTEKQRYYHTLNHLDSMFFHFDKVKNELQNPQLVSLAIFFHE